MTTALDTRVTTTVTDDARLTTTVTDDARAGHAGWTPVCRLDDLIPERGVAALVGGVQVAVFRMYDDQVRAVDNLDPRCGAYVLSRGIVGTRDGRPVVVSPMHKEAYDLETGVCLDAPEANLPVHRARVRAGVIEVALR